MIYDMRHKITFLKYETTKDEEGVVTKKWVPFKEAWAARQNLHGSEFFAAQQAQSKATVKFITRYIKDITTDMRIKHGNEIFNIIYIDNIKGLNREIEFLCELVDQ